MKTVVFLTPADARPGFALAGARQLTPEFKEVEGTLAEVLADPATAVVVVDERLLPALPEERWRELESGQPVPLVVLPAPERGPEALDYALRLVRRAIGYQVRLNL